MAVGLLVAASMVARRSMCVPYADQGLNCIPDSVSDEQALFVGDVLATGFWAARISEISPMTRC